MDDCIRLPKHLFKLRRPNRTHHDEATLRRLGESMKLNGQLNPLTCLPDYTIVCGERRWSAAMLTDGLEELDAKIIEGPLTEKDIRLLRVTENLHREDITQYERYLELKGFQENDPAMTAREIAEALCVDPSLVTRYMSPDRCVAAVREAFRLGQIGIKAIYEISKDSQPEIQKELLARALGGHADDVARQRRRHPAGTVSAARTCNLRIDRPTGNIITVKGDGLDLEAIAEELTAAAKDARKALSEGFDAKTWAAMCRDRAKASV